MTESEFCAALRGHYDPKAYVVIPQVRNATGFGRAVRTADAIVVSLWPSRGVEAYGFEFKDSRSDLLRELKEPAKANEIGRFCSQWWVVASPRCLVHADELPSAWGLMLAGEGRLKVGKKCQPKTPEPVTWEFVAAVLRSAADVVTEESAIQARITKAVRAAEQGVFEQVRAARDAGAKGVQGVLDMVRADIRTFEEASGVSLNSYDSRDKRKLGEAVRFVLDGGLDAQAAELRHIAERAERIKAAALSVSEGELVWK